MSWRIAESLNQLLRQLNAAFPNRSKLSDGGIGDVEHASRTSDHNPWFKDKKGVGIVSARDFTHDPAHGLDCNWLANQLVKSRDPRIKYVIWNDRICSSKVSPWIWRTYKGKNPHKHHLHLSVMSDSYLFDDDKPWRLGIAQELTPENIGNKIEEIRSSATEQSGAFSIPQTPSETAVKIQPSSIEDILDIPGEKLNSISSTIEGIKETANRGMEAYETAIKVTSGKSTSFFVQILGLIISFVVGVFGFLRENWKLIAVGAVGFIVICIVIITIFTVINALKMRYAADPTKNNVE